MRRISYLIGLVSLVLMLSQCRVEKRQNNSISMRTVGPQPDGSILVPTNQLLRPAGFQILFPGRPVDLAQYFDQGSLERILAYGWPGNVREIAMVARRASVELMAKGRVHIALVGEGDRRIELSGPQPKTLAAMAAEDRSGLGNTDGQQLAVSESVERSRILLALEESGGSKVVAARRLGLSRSTLYRKLRRLEILSKED